MIISVAEIAVPAITDGSAAVKPSVPSVCTKYCWPAVRLDCAPLMPLPICTLAVPVSAAAPLAKPMKFSAVRVVEL